MVKIRAIVYIKLLNVFCGLVLWLFIHRKETLRRVPSLQVLFLVATPLYRPYTYTFFVVVDNFYNLENGLMDFVHFCEPQMLNN